MAARLGKRMLSMSGRLEAAADAFLLHSHDVQEQEMKWIPWMVAALILAHLLAFMCWIYCLVSEKPTRRRKIY